MKSTKGVRDKKGKTYNRIVVDPVRLAPRRHDEGVVEGDEDDGVHALGLELVQVGQVRGDVLFLAGRGEGAGDGDQDDFLVGEFWGVLLVPCLISRCEIGVKRDNGPLLASYLVGRPHTVRSRVPVGWT